MSCSDKFQNSFEPLIEQGSAELGLSLSKIQVEQLCAYLELLREWNDKINLTGVKPEEYVTRHILDSLTFFSAAAPAQDAALIDVGTGAGLPGIPLKIVRPDLSIVLLDALEKRARFLESVVKALGLEQIRVLHGRAEIYGRDFLYRAKFDYAVSRAVADLRILAEYMLPFVRIGGAMIAFKGRNVIDEIKGAEEIIKAMGGDQTRSTSVMIPITKEERNLLVVEKMTPTPEKFPRSAAKIKRSAAALNK